MSGYFSQLMRQSGVKIAGAAVSHESLSAPAAPSLHDVEIEESTFTPSTGVVTQSSALPDLPTNSAPIGSEPRSQADAPLETQSEIESGEEPNAVELREPHVSFEAKSETTDAGAASSSVATPAASPPATKAAPSRSTVIHEVMDWIAAPPEHRALEDDRRLVPSGSPSSAVSFHQTVEHARPDRSPAAKSGDEAWSVHIGAIHLEIEAPREKPSPRAVAPQPASPAASESRGSRLRRYYLRSC